MGQGRSAPYGLALQLFGAPGPSPGAPPFVEVGDRVEPDSVVCIIEVMKLMNTIHAGASGVVREIRVENSQPVEFGQVLLVIGPQ